MTSALQSQSGNRARPLMLLSLGIFVFAVAFSLFTAQENIAVPQTVLIAFRWIGISLFAVYAFKRRSLTVWIALGMLAGAEFGHDFPRYGENLQVLSKIF